MIGPAEVAPPCVKLWGPGPTGATCSACVHALGIQYGNDPLWFCKALRDYAERCGEPLSDQIHPEWRACSRFERRAAA